MSLPFAVAALIDAAADKHAIPREVARAVAWVESRGEQSSVSPAGAIGVMQLMPDTARALGVDPRDVAQNIAGGVKFLAGQWKRFGTLRKALAAYNWGPGRVASGRPLPQQVKTYIERVLARATVELKEGGAMAQGGPEVPPSSPRSSPPRGSEPVPFVPGGSPPSLPASPSSPQPLPPGAAERLASVEAFAVAVGAALEEHRAATADQIAALAQQLNAVADRVASLERAFDEPIPATAGITPIDPPVFAVLPALVPAVTGSALPVELPSNPSDLKG